MNPKRSSKGLFFGNLRGLEMNPGDGIRWYIIAPSSGAMGMSHHPGH